MENGRSKFHFCSSQNACLDFVVVCRDSYGEGKGLQLVNVTYSGDTLVATKVTGDMNIPRGKVSFTAELSPTNFSSLEPLTVPLEEDNDKQVPTIDNNNNDKNEVTETRTAKTPRQLWRYPGKGQIAEPGYSNNKFVDGQLVMLNQGQFSFIWVPNTHFVLFSRPTPEQTIQLLRDTLAREDELENMRRHVATCFEIDLTESWARFHAQQAEPPEPIRRISLLSDLEKLQKTPFNNEAPSMEGQTQHDHNDKENDEMSGNRNFWHLSKWRACIDRLLGGNSDQKRP